MLELQPLSTSAKGRAFRSHPSAAGIILVFASLATILAIRSTGCAMDDDILHFLLARSSWSDPTLLLDIWGRPGFTIPHAAVAWVGSMETGLLASRLLTVAAATAVSWLAFLTARRLRAPLPAVVPLLWWMMPQCCRQASTPHTEMMAALYIAAGTWLLSCGRRRSAAIVFALLGVTRHELVVFLVPLGLYFLYRRDWLAALLLGWAELAWNIAALLVHRPAPIRRFFDTSEPGSLGHGNPLHYFNRWVEMAGFTMVGLTFAGFWIITAHELRVRRRIRGRALPTPVSRRRRGRIFIAAGAIALVGLHTLLYLFNRFSSGGYARFLIPASPCMAICAGYPIGLLWRAVRTTAHDRNRARWAWALAIGIVGVVSCYSGDWLYVRHPWRWLPLGLVLTFLFRPSRNTAIVFLAGLALSLANLWLPIVGLHYRSEEQILLAATLREIRVEYPSYHIVGTSPWTWFFLGQPLDSHVPPPWGFWQRGEPPHLIYVWEVAHGEGQFPLAQVVRFPNEPLRQFWHTDDRARPLLRVYRRLPDR